MRKLICIELSVQRAEILRKALEVYISECELSDDEFRRADDMLKFIEKRLNRHL